MDIFFFEILVYYNVKEAYNKSIKRQHHEREYYANSGILEGTLAALEGFRLVLGKIVYFFVEIYVSFGKCVANKKK